MFKQSGGDDASSAHKSLMATAVGTADAKTMEKFAHVAEKFVHKSVVAALAPYKEAVMRFQQVQLDTVGCHLTTAGGHMLCIARELTQFLGATRRLF